MPLRRPAKKAEKQPALIHIGDDIYVRSAPAGSRFVAGEKPYLLSPISMETLIAWDMCGGCGNFITLCSCKRGVTPPNSIRHLCGEVILHETPIRDIKEPEAKPRLTRPTQRPSTAAQQPRITRPTPKATPTPLRRPTPPRNTQQEPAPIRPTPLRRPKPPQAMTSAIPDAATLDRMARAANNHTENQILSRMNGRPRK